MPPTSPIVIYALPGSQYVCKVLSALTARKIDHFVKLVPVDETARKQMIPSGGHLVPELKVGEGEDALIISDSENILEWFDDNYDTKFYPVEKASELSTRVDKIVAGSVWYYNWVYDETYASTIRAKFVKLLPAFIFLFRNQIMDMILASKRKAFEGKVAKALSIEEADLQDEPKIRTLLVEELKFFQSLLTKPSSEQPFLLPGKEGTAPDFALYAQMERLVGAGTASDFNFPPAIQEVKEQGSGLERLWEWHDNMQKSFPVQYKGKSPPESNL
jgi:glutathione S-transferase